MSFQLHDGSLKCIYLDREAAARGESAWVVECDSVRYVTRKFTIMPDDECPEFVESKGPPLSPLHVDGPVFWLETTAAIEFG